MKFIYLDCQNYYGSVLDNDYVDTLKLARTISVSCIYSD